MKWIRRLAIAFAVLVAALALAVLLARLSDGPIGPFPGGPLRGGELAQEPQPDWTALSAVREVELGSLNPARSRTTWLVVHDDMPYVPCGYPEFRLFKQWPHELREDGRVVLRIQGRRYPRHAVYVTDPTEFAALARLLNAKYQAGGVDDPERLWFFRLEPERP